MIPKIPINLVIIILAIFGTVGCSTYEQPKQRIKRLSDELSEAAGIGNLSKMKELISLGADVNGICCGVLPPINAAISNNQTEAVKFLINNGANVNIDAYEGTPLLQATLKRDLELVRLLLEKGANPDATFPMEGGTVKTEAQKNGDKEMIQLLKKYSTSKK